MKHKRDICKAGLWGRFLAQIVDISILYIILKVTHLILDLFGIFDHFEISIIILCVTYCLFFIGGKGLTIGKMLLGLRVQKLNGGCVSYFREFLREVIGKLISIVFLFFGFLWIVFSRNNRGWHDYIAGTVVVKEYQKKRNGLMIAIAICSIFIFWLGVKMVRIVDLHINNVLRTEALDVSNIKAEAYPRFLTYLEKRANPPIDYVINKFNTYDTVIIGEEHRIHENCNFIAKLIDPLYHEAGVRYLAMEFIKYKNTSLANRLVTSEKYDEEIALEIFRDYIFPSWGYQEYMDILRSVWEVNRKLPPEAEKLKIVGLDRDINGWDLYLESIWTIDDFIKLFGRDKYMAKVLSKEVMTKRKKTLVYVGGHHDFIHYKQPLLYKGKFLFERSPRFGYLLYEKYGDRIFHIALHRKYPQANVINKTNKEKSDDLTSFLETIFYMNDNKPIGFDVRNSPFAGLRDNTSYYFVYQKYVTFSDVASGYIFLKPIDQLEKVTWAEGFVNEDTFEKWKSRGLRHKWLKKGECDTPKELDEKVKSVQYSQGLVKE